jgi:rhodanese-related sulfurtransferase
MKAIISLFLIVFVSILIGCQSQSSVETASQGNAPSKIEEISVAEAKPIVSEKKTQFIDVRTTEEYAGGHAPNAVNIPLDTLPKELAKLDQSQPVYVICQTGRRSEKGAKILTEAGFKKVYNIEGGTSAWTAAGFPTEK